MITLPPPSEQSLNYMSGCLPGFNMADEVDALMQDLQRHIQNANVQVTNLSSIARKGDDKLVEQFLSESVFVKSASQSQLAENRADVLASQLYIACFWGFKDIVKGILDIAKRQDINVDVNAQNKDTLWTPLHAATFQEHGPIVMMLLANGAEPEIHDSAGRSPKDFASASDKCWGHFAMIGLDRTPKHRLVQMGIIKQQYDITSDMSPRGQSSRSTARPIVMAPYAQDSSVHDGGGYLQAVTTGDVLANTDDDDLNSEQNTQPQFSVYK